MKSRMFVQMFIGATLLWTTQAMATDDATDTGDAPSSSAEPAGGLEDAGPADDAADVTAHPDDMARGPKTPPEYTMPREEPAQNTSKLGIAAAVKAGATFHTLFNELSPMLLLEVEAGVLLMERHLELDVALAWARPRSTVSENDPRLVDGSYDWEIKQDFLSLGLMIRYRIFDGASRFNGYGALGPRLLMLHTRAEGESSGGADFGTNEQFETRFGGYGALGGEFNIGPGAILLEVGMTFGDLNGYITGDTSSAALDTCLGYRFMFDL